MPSCAESESRRRRLEKARTTSAVSGITARLISVSFQLSHSSQPTRPSTESVSRISTVSVEVAAAATPFTS